MKPRAIDLFCGLGGWTQGLLAEGYDVIGFDIERHAYEGERYPAQLVLQHVRTLHGAQFKDASLIVASPPCQTFSYMAMPWTRAKQMAHEYRTGTRDIKQLTELFDACFRIQREACEAAGRLIPLVVENVRGAQAWVGRSRWNFGSFHLWGDVPALMPIPIDARKVPGFRFDGSGRSFQREAVKVAGQNWSRYNETGEVSPHWRIEGIKNTGGSWFNVAHNTTSGKGRNPDGRNDPSDSARANRREFPRDRLLPDGVKQGGSWFHDSNGTLRSHSSKSSKRKAASARIAKIPFVLSSHIARTFHPGEGLRMTGC